MKLIPLDLAKKVYGEDLIQKFIDNGDLHIKLTEFQTEKVNVIPNEQTAPKIKTQKVDEDIIRELNRKSK